MPRTNSRWAAFECEVIDLRALRPLDTDTFVASVPQDPPGGRRRRGLAHRQSRGDEISAQLMENAFFDLDAPCGASVHGRVVPIPYAKHLEQAACRSPR